MGLSAIPETPNLVPENDLNIVSDGIFTMQNTVPETVEDKGDDSILSFELSLCVKKRNHIKTPTRRPKRNVPLSSIEETFRKRIRKFDSDVDEESSMCLPDLPPCSLPRYQ